MLQSAGHVAYFAGGCVRDAILGRQPKDFDVATDATPERVREVFGKGKTLAFGAAFGVIGVLPESNTARSKTEPIEVATFRSDGTYSDGRRPDHVHFGDARNDALRRDFTINGLFYDPASNRVIDYVGGQEDLQLRRLRTIGKADDRFEEDKLRMLRAVRFATTLEFQLDPDVHASIERRADEISLVSSERIGAELRRLVGAQSAAAGLELLLSTKLAKTVFPELDGADHERLRLVFGNAQERDFPASIAIICDSIVKQSPAEERLRIIDRLGSRWKLSNEEQRRVKTAMRLWPTVVNAHALPWSIVQPVLLERDIADTLEVASAVAAADGSTTEGIDRCRVALTWDADKLNPPPLLTGQDLQASGYKPGPVFKHWLKTVRDQQLDGQLKTTKDAMAWVSREAGR
ncbi:MAG: CCA tRNA nucleotidyltransferase [Planctomycetota bacterium]